MKYKQSDLVQHFKKYGGFSEHTLILYCKKCFDEAVQIVFMYVKKLLHAQHVQRHKHACNCSSPVHLQETTLEKIIAKQSWYEVRSEVPLSNQVPPPI